MRRRTNAIGADLCVIGFAIPQPPVQRSTSSTITAFAATRWIIGRQVAGCLLAHDAGKDDFDLVAMHTASSSSRSASRVSSQIRASCAALPQVAT
jgi:hypothetical protein